MEQFIVSARKYRPATFDSVVGQQHITTTLKNAIRTGQIAQAYLFCGPRGVGKTTCARILAKTVNCENLTPDIEACGTCNACMSFQKNASFNVHELDAASNNSVEDIRYLVDQVRYPPQHGRYKVYIIDEVHMLSNAAFNAFLKTLEEPPPYAIFILATTEKHKIIPTILSRCQVYDFNRIQVSDMVRHLQRIAEKEGVQAEEAALHLIAQKADGGLRDALSMFDLLVTFSTDRKLTYAGALEHLHILDYDYYFRVVDMLFNRQTTEALLVLDEILRKGFDAQLFVVGLEEHLRNLLMSREQATLSLLEVPETAKLRFQEQAQRLSPSWIMTALNLAHKFELEFRSVKNARVHTELLLLKLAHLQDAIELAKRPVVVEEKKNELNEADPARRPAVPRKVRTTPKLDEIQKEKKMADEPAGSGKEVPAATPASPLTVEEPAVSLQEAWQQLAQEHKDDAQLHYLLSKPYEVRQNTICLSVESRALLHLTEEYKPLWRKRLLELTGQSYDIEAKIEIKDSASDDAATLYSTKDKLRYLAKEYPHLKKIWEHLQLTPKSPI
ncbi:DNA polymerase III subunit gamma/tau [Thermonema rossianum]|jgi:DNA polymerase-3 subunit gamma/tau|uniref:DNA polymerase III subunit gamma/tau n=1 Tax=Thermonema rossianum TaxID=55505 RepID=UPI000570D549|nr:DNA polymerase III subunit gamma/tau [Thermonema rossianum]